MKNLSQQKRKNIRLQEYDYSQPGLYFVTICTRDKVCLFGDVIDDEMVLNRSGKIVKNDMAGNTAAFFRCGIG